MQAKGDLCPHGLVMLAHGEVVGQLRGDHVCGEMPPVNCLALAGERPHKLGDFPGDQTGRLANHASPNWGNNAPRRQNHVTQSGKTLRHPGQVDQAQIIKSEAKRS